MAYNPMESANPSTFFNDNNYEWESRGQYPTMDYSGLSETVPLPIQENIPQQNVSSMGVNTTNPAVAPTFPLPDPSKEYHAEWGVIKDDSFHPLTLKHQRDFENLFNEGAAIQDFYFWQANLGGYCLADMIRGTVVSPDGSFVLERRIVEGAPHPGRKKKNKG